MKTSENYEVIKLSTYDVYTSIYMKTKFDGNLVEKGFSGVVRNPNLDDRFICQVFCIWNANGACVYCNNNWGQYKVYKLDVEQANEALLTNINH